MRALLLLWLLLDEGLRKSRCHRPLDARQVEGHKFLVVGKWYVSGWLVLRVVDQGGKLRSPREEG